MKQTKVMSTKFTTMIIALFVALFVVALLIIPYHLTDMSAQSSTKLNAYVFADNTFKLDLDTAISLPDENWKKVENFNFGLKSEPTWLKLKIPANKSLDRRLFLINYGLLDHVDLWMLTPAESNHEVLSAYKTGDAFEYDHRVVKFEQFLFPVPNTSDDIWVYLKVQSKGPLKVPVEVWFESSFMEYSGLHKMFIGVFFGFMIAMGLSNLFIFASNRNILFAIYTCYVTSIGFAVASIHGLGFHYIWPNNLWLQEFAIPIFTALTMIFVISLTILLLDLKLKSPRIYTLLTSIRYIFIILLALCFFVPYELVIKILLLLLVCTTPLILIAGTVLALKGNVVAKYFCAAWAVLLISSISIVVENFGLYHSMIDSVYLIMVGSIGESLLLALALAIKFNEQLKIADEARYQAIKNEQEAIDARDELIALQENNQTELEYSIEERTLELEIALRELAEKNQDLERLSAIDPLTNLMNRRYFDKRLLAEVRRSRRELTPLGIAMLDIDHFKLVNDTHGHLCGDYCLKVFADILKEHVKRPSDVVCRYGGEEFVLILPNTDEEGLIKLLEKIRKAVETKKILFEGKDIPLTVSIGGCSRVISSEDEHTLIVAFVDKRLYQAKASGRNKVIVETY